ncbi:MAG: adenylate kinase [Candidatus Dormibacteria bacterium]
MKHYIICGPPGSGKGTQSAQLAAHFHLRHVSTGELLRKEIAEETELGKKVQDLMNRGELVPDSYMLAMIRRVLLETTGVNGVLLDGYPRTKPQAEGLADLLRELGMTIDLIVHLSVPTDVILERIQHRATVEGRSDDSVEVLKQRLKEYEEKTIPTIEYYRAQGAPMVDVDGTPDVDTVTTRLIHVLEKGNLEEEHHAGRELSTEEA